MPPGLPRRWFTFLPVSVMAPLPFFTADSVSSAYQLRFHFVWRTHWRRSVLSAPDVKTSVRAKLRNIAETYDYHLLEADVESDAVYALLSLRPEHAPSDVTRIVKGNIAAEVRNRFGSAHFLHGRYDAALRREGLSGVWESGYYAGTVGSATTAQVKAHLRRRRDGDGAR
jgi:REP element-mobilizing transposase RayT